MIKDGIFGSSINEKALTKYILTKSSGIFVVNKHKTQIDLALKCDNMDVYFDFELNPNADQPEDPNYIVYRMIREFVQSRYKVLDDELYANCTEDNRPFCVLLLEPEGLIIRYVDINEPLLTKVQRCISEDDFGYITDVIWKKIQAKKRRN